MSEQKLASQRLIEVPLQLLRAKASLFTLGIPFLDEALTGIIDSDLMLVGAKSGRGKTQFLIEIAKHLLLNGKRVTFFALEAEQNEVEMRLLYQVEAGLYFKNLERAPRKVKRIDYRAWRLGNLDVEFAHIREEAMAYVSHYFGRLTTIYRSKRYAFSDFSFDLEMLEGSTDCILVDHLHYFDQEAGSLETQFKFQSDLMKQMRDKNLFYNVPFIVAGHVRKDLKNIMPDQEDFMGSSDIYKNATLIVMLAPRPDGYDPQKGIHETLISLPKVRTGSLGNLCGVLYFSNRHQSYSPRFGLTTLSYDRLSVNDLPREKWPDWALPADSP